MRLIDADAFVEFLRYVVKKQKYDDLKIDEALTVADVIDAVISELEGTSLDGFTNAPTIEERKKGKWIEIALSNHTYKCSVCGRLLVNITDGKNTVTKNYPFCHCGADMRKEGEK